MTTVEILRSARALIDTPQKWCKGEMRRREPGGRMRYCAVGAVNEAAPVGDGHGAIIRACDALAAATPGRRIYLVNDDPGTTHADVMAIFDRAIAAQGRSA